MLQLLNKFRLAFVALAAFALMGCGNPTIVEDTAELDQAFIPLLYLSERADTTTVEAIRIFDRFVRRWHLFYGNYYTANQINPKWGAGLDQINQQVNAIEDSLVDRRSLSGIHTMLESIRDDMIHLRRENQIAYALDEFNTFHRIMEPLWESAAEMETEPTRAEQFIKPILRGLTDAEKQWKRVQMVRIDPMLYGLSPDEEKQLRAGIQTIQITLNQLNTAINNRDSDTIISLLKTVKQDFATIYLLFGDFD